MFHSHTSMLAANEEKEKLARVNGELLKGNENMKLMLVGLENLKQENEYLTQKLNYAEQVEKVLRTKLEESELKPRSYQNSSNLVQQYHDNNKKSKNVGIGFNYEAPTVKNTSKGKSHQKDVPHVLKSVDEPLFK